MGIILSRQLLMGVAQVNKGTCEVWQSIFEVRAVGGLDWAPVWGDVVGVEAISSFHPCDSPQALELVDSYWRGGRRSNQTFL